MSLHACSRTWYAMLPLKLLVSPRIETFLKTYMSCTSRPALRWRRTLKPGVWFCRQPHKIQLLQLAN